MNTITLWLLISIGSNYYGSGAYPTNVVTQFATQSECERVHNLLRESKEYGKPFLRCIQTTIVK